MSDSAKQAFLEKFERIRAAYSKELPIRMRDMQERWQLFQQGQPEALSELADMAHKVAGAAATFGYARLTKTTRAIEKCARELLQTGTDQRPELLQLLEALLAEASVHAASPDDGANAAESQTSGTLQAQTIPAKVVGEQKSSKVAATPVVRKLVYLVSDDAMFGEMLMAQANYFAYNVQLISEVHLLKDAISLSSPAAVIIDWPLSGADKPSIRLVHDINQGSEQLIPVLFLSSRADIVARLEAVRAGAAAYFIKPADINAMIDRLDALTTGRPQEPYRVLVVDDSPVMTQLYAHMLQEAHMEVCQLTEPMHIMQHLRTFSPELILMDMYMPDCSGVELAAVIRQQADFDSIPIVFLSSETNIDRQLVAMREGGDDFLTKPIQPEHLVASVSMRASRFRVLRSLMERDGMTGLFNHTKILESLEIEISRAERQCRPLSFAMVDLDHFKSVNDEYGHPVGDQVICSLARLLKDRLRKTDLVGRYGGEEFAIIMPDTEAEIAVRILDGAREAFASLRHTHDEQEFSATFSAGVSSYRSAAAAGELIKEADSALYQAKHAGRDQVSIHQLV